MCNVSILHLFIYREIREKAEGRMFVSHSKVLEVVRRRLFQIPRFFHYPFIKEMVELQLLKRLDKTKYELIGGKKDKILKKYEHYPI